MITEKSYETLRDAAITALGYITDALIPVAKVLAEMSDDTTSSSTPAPGLSSGSVPLTPDQIVQMHGRQVVVPESLNYSGGIGRVDLKRNIINGCAPTADFAWPLEEYGKSFIAYGIDGGESVPGKETEE